MSLENLQQHGGGFGVSSSDEVHALSKALETGYALGVGRTGGASLRVESLEASLKVTTFNSSHIKFWKKIPKTPAYSTIEEYNQLTDYGTGAFSWVNEGELPQASDSSYIRRAAYVKFLGTVRSVTHQASIVHPAHGDLIALENQNGINVLLQQIETFLFTGNSTLAFNGQAAQWDGLDALIDPTSVIDMAGQALENIDIETGAQIIADNNGWATDLFLSNKSHSDLAKSMYPSHRVVLPAMTNGTVGQSISRIDTNGGMIELNATKFVQKTKSAGVASTSPNAPATPASIAAGSATGSTGNFTKGDPAPGSSTYVNYVVTACNRFGESAPTAVQVAVVTVTTTVKSTNQYFPLTITNNASIGAFAPEYYRIYRSEASPTNAVPQSMSSYYLIAQVPAASQTAGGVTVFNDLNYQLPNTYTAYLLELSPAVIQFRQLLGMMKMDLAVLGPAYRWMVLMYGTPIMFAPLKGLRYLNIKALSVPSSLNPIAS